MNVFTWLARALGFGSKPKLLGPIGAVSEPILYNQHTRIGGNLTPDAVSEIMLLADQGRMWQLVDLFDESRQRDCHLQAVLATREIAISSLPWQVTPASKKKRDKKIALFVESFLANFGMDDPSPEPRDLPHLIAHLAGACSYGHAVAQTFYAKKDGYVVPISAAPVMPRRFVFDQADGKLRFWDPNGHIPYPGIDLLEAFPGRFIVYQPRINGGGATREGLMRPLLWAALFRNWGIRDWLQLAELAWKPWRIGTYTKAAGDKDKDALRKALQYLTTTGVALLPETAQFKAEWAKSTGKSGDGQHASLCGFMAAEMSKGVLGATLTVDQGTVGTQALGNVHNEVRHDIRDSDARSIASIIRRHLIAPAVRMNFGADALVPGFEFITDESIDLAAFATAIAALRKAGLRIPASFVRETVGIPEPKDGEEMLGDGAPEPVDPNAKPGTKPGDKPPADDAAEENQKLAA